MWISPEFMLNGLVILFNFKLMELLFVIVCTVCMCYACEADMCACESCDDEHVCVGLS